MAKTPGNYIVLGDGKPMEWIIDRYTFGFYFSRVATVFKDWATAKRRIEQDQRVNGPGLCTYRILRIVPETQEPK